MTGFTEGSPFIRGLRSNNVRLVGDPVVHAVIDGYVACPNSVSNHTAWYIYARTAFVQGDIEYVSDRVTCLTCASVLSHFS